MHGNGRLAAVGAGEEYELRPPDPFAGNWDAKTRDYRLMRFLQMGFSLTDATTLADARVWTGDVERILGRGCGHELAAQILR